ncbi:hypothetical protein [Sphaerisporangium perillae]|uniref:hypothetical protein n=1 Tax=Sphaerisporangium perillae TaxID=2935860 RepID=UPI00200F93ED|nr:hypothetical protein [Sphaerisporangium perillae]
MDPGYIVVVIFGVIVVAAILGVGLVTIVLRGIRREPVQWPVSPDDWERRHQGRRQVTAPPAEERGGEHPEWTGRELAGDDLRPAGTHQEKHAMPGRARWW